jgi:tetratricopeptide (TPR) repeat protein
VKERVEVRSKAVRSTTAGGALSRRTAARGTRPQVTPLAALALAALLAVTSCGDDGGPGPAETAAQRNEAGWEYYLIGDYAAARGSFEEARALDTGLAEALLGLAWCDAQLAEYAASVEEFNQTLESKQYVIDAYAGRAAAALQLPDFDLAVASADSALKRDPHYRFSRHSGYDFADLRLILAQSYFALGLYSSAQAQVEFIYPDNGLDPSKPDTWIVGDKAYPTYEAALSVLIELLWNLESS